MKITYMILLVGVFSLLNAYSQKTTSYKFNKRADLLDISKVDPQDIKNHILGEGIAKKMALFTDAYTKVEPATPTSPVDKTVIHKPVIYIAVKKLNKYYSKGVKKAIIDSAKATEEFTRCLDIAISIAFQNTSNFEAKLKSIKETEDIYNLFASVVLE